ncbi:protein of unknown function [Cupriavidus taiwanensis]|nr:protein of unknown function [Cupriavidus taiwanensis]
MVTPTQIRALCRYILSRIEIIASGTGVIRRRMKTSDTTKSHHPDT